MDSKWQYKALPFIVLFLLAALVFSKTVYFNFVYLDDNRIILGSEKYLKNTLNVLTAFREDIFHGRSNYYRPIFTLTFILDAQICGIQPWCYHATNIFFHLIFVSILFIFFTKFVKPLWVAFMLVLLFSVHPVVVSDVAWINGRTDTLLGIFFLASFVTLIGWIDTNKNKHLFLHILFFNFALYSKELAFLIIPLIFLYCYLFKKKLPSTVHIFVFWVSSSLIWLFLRAEALRTSNHAAITLPINSLVQGTLIYVGKIVPVTFSLYPIARDSNINTGIAIIIAIIFLLFIFKRIRKQLIFTVFWLLLLIFPATLKLGTEEPVYLEYRMYLPLVGIFLFSGIIISALNKKYERSIITVAAILLILFSVISFNRLGAYTNEVTFWNKAIQDSPHDADLIRGAGWIEQYMHNNPDRAAQLYNQAIAVNPRVPYARPELAVIDINKHNYDSAEIILHEELAIRKTDYAWLQLGRVYYVQGKKLEAANAWLEAVSVSPNYLPAITNLALVYSDLKNTTEAKKYYYKAIKLGGLESESRNILIKLKYLESI